MSEDPRWITDKLDHDHPHREAARIRRLAVIGNYVPRQCGIATFTTDLCEAVVREYEDLEVLALAMNDTDRGYAYPSRVRFEIAQQDLSAYRRAADFLELNNIDLVCVQHEYGIYGGDAGHYLLSLLRELRMPVVTTLHTILREPPKPEFRDVMLELVALSDRVITMSRRGVEFLNEIYNVPPDKIDMIPHGIPDVPFVDPNFYKDQFGVEGKFVALTFGLLAPNKGIENAIRALPPVVERYPNFAYIVLGATHPHWIQKEGERYREFLVETARECGVDQNVILHNRFVSLEELVEYIGAADVYLTPYLTIAQITSGTLAYAVGAGKAVISTPYWHAEELLAEGRGRLVPIGDLDAIAAQMLDLLDNEAERHAIRKRAYLHGREMVWSSVARQYMRSFVRAREERKKQPHSMYQARVSPRRPTELPGLNLDHLRRLTDSTGILQHAIGTLPNYDEGYATHDNARALVCATLLQEVGDAELATAARPLSEKYAAFLWHAFNHETGRFRNRMAYDRHWHEEVGSEDTHGRALWALGTVAGRSSDARTRSTAGRLFNLALPVTVEFEHPRAWAYTLIAIHEYMRRFYGDSAAQSVREALAERLYQTFKDNSAPDWPWFSQEVTYACAKLPHAMLLCGKWMMRGEMSEAGLRSLQWLADVQRAPEGHFVPVGNGGYWRHGGERARFDQLPLEAHAMVSASLEAYQVTSDARWREVAQCAFDWFLGRNDVGLPLYDPTSGGCSDGLHPQRTNQNQGAEATLSFLLALSEMRMAKAFGRRELSVLSMDTRDIGAAASDPATPA